MTLAIARKAFEHDRIQRNDAEFRYLGSGVSRQVYLHIPTGKAYKVPGLYNDRHSFVNYHEAATSAWFRENYKIPGVIWPDFIVHDVDGTWVSEVTFFDHDGSVPNTVMRRFETWLMDAGVSDACAGVNVFSCKGFIVPIDLGYYGLCGVSPWDPEYWIARWDGMRKWEDETDVRQNPPAIRSAVMAAKREIRLKRKIERERFAEGNPAKIPGCNCFACQVL